MAGGLTDIPLPVILSAMDGNEAALSAVTTHYQKYIRALSTKRVYDNYGNEYVYLDKDMCSHLETKLICSIVCKFKVLS